MKEKIIAVVLIVINLLAGVLMLSLSFISVIKPDFSLKVSQLQDRWEQTGEEIFITLTPQIESLYQSLQKGEKVSEELVEKYKRKDALWKEYASLTRDYWEMRTFLMLRPVMIIEGIVFLLNAGFILWKVRKM